MEEHRWGTRGCLNKIKFYNNNEDCYYWRKWAIYMFKEGEWEKIGNLDTLNELLDLNKSLLDGIYEYVIDEHLEIKWSLAFEQHKIFNEELKRIDRELGDVLSTNKLKDIAKIQQSASALKLKITESEIFSKYLMHKEMNKHRERGKLKESKNFINDLAKDYDMMKTEEDRTAILEKFKNIKNLLSFKHSENQELEEFKRKYLEDVDELKKKQEKYIEIYENEKNDLIAKNTKLEQELNRIKTMQKENEESMEDSYDEEKIN